LLAGALAVVMLTRRDSEPRSAPQVNVPPPGSVKAKVQSTPPGARVKRRDTGEILGTTPVQIAANTGDAIPLRIEKPGYLATEPTLSTGPQAAEVDGPAFPLAQVDQFQGTWRLPTGDLRNFARRGDEVDISKLAAVSGAREFFKTYSFVFAEHGTTAVAFGGDDSVVDGRGPNEPSCHIRVHVEYRYDVASDQLEQSRDKLEVDFAGGKCIVQSRETETTQLARAEAVSDVHELDAPVAAPIAPPKQSKKQKVVPLDPTTKVTKPTMSTKQSAKSDQQLEDSTKNQGPAPTKASPTYTKQAPSQAPQQANEPDQQQQAPEPQILKK
jgi:hypothetical protein